MKGVFCIDNYVTPYLVIIWTAPTQTWADLWLFQLLFQIQSNSSHQQLLAIDMGLFQAIIFILLPLIANFLLKIKIGSSLSRWLAVWVV